MALDGVYDVAYHEAVRSLGQQTAIVAELRNRASALIATASIAVSLLGSRAFSAPPFGWLAVVCFVLLSVAVLVVVWPQADWRFAADAYELLFAHAVKAGMRAPASGPLVLDLVAHMAADRRANAAHLARLSKAFRTGACLLAIQMLATVAAASGGL